jgi:DHA1 family tetracycline resistance protein-like MFS transporter
LDRRVIIPIFFIVFINFLGASIVLPTLPLYADQHFHAPPDQVALVVSCYYAALFIAAPFIGRLSDRYGRIPVLIVSQLGTVISFVMLGAAPGMGMLFAGRILDGITGGNVIVAQAYVTDITPREHRTEALGVIFAAFGLGYVFGPALGGVVGAFVDDRAPFWIGALVSLAMVILTWLTLKESLTPEERLRRRQQTQVRLTPADIARNHTFLLVALIAFGAQLGIAMLQATFSLYGAAVLFHGADAKTVDLGVGLLFAVVGVAQLVTQLYILQPSLARFGEHRLVIIGAVSRATGFFIVVAVPSPWIAVLSMIALAMGSGLMMPSLQAICTMTVADELRGGILGWYQSATSLSFIVGSAISGQLFDTSPFLPFTVTTLVYVALMIPSALLFRQGKRSSLIEAPTATG